MLSALVSFHSIRRGSGKSTLIANLAGLLVSQGKRVVVVETDFHSPSLNLFFQLTDQDAPHSFNDFICGRCSLEQATYEVTPQLAWKLPGSLYLSPASQSQGEAYEELRKCYTFERLHAGLQQIEQIFHPDVIFVDNMAGLHEEALLSAAASTSLVLILQADPQDFQGTAVAVEVAGQLKVPEVYLVLNNAPAAIDLERAHQQLEQVYQRKVIAMLPQSNEIASLASGGLLVIEKPRAPILAHFQQILGYLVKA